MPPSISGDLRRTLTDALMQQFDLAEELDEWLHLPHPALAGNTPFERVVEGDGFGVLRALRGGRTAGRRHCRRTAAQARGLRPTQ